MYARLVILLPCLIIGGLLFASFAAASGFAADEPFRPLSLNQVQPKSYWYEQTFGVTNVPYLADTDHLYFPVGVAVDGAGNLWVAEGMGSRALKYGPDGAFLMSIGVAGVLEIADETHLAEPGEAAVDSQGNVWVIDFMPQRAVKYNPAGEYLMHLGATWEAGTDNEHFNGPIGIAIDSADNLYISDRDNHRIQVFNSTGYYSETLGTTGVPGSDNAHFNSPLRIAVDSDNNLYVPDRGNHRVQIFDSRLNYSATIGVTGVPGSDNSHFNGPRGVAIDDDYIYVADSDNHRVQIFDRTTRVYIGTKGSFGSGDDEFDFPSDVGVDSSGNLYVSDVNNHRVQKFDSELTYVHTFGTTGVPYLTDGKHYNLPFGVAVDSSGNIAITEDWGRGQRVIKVDPSGNPLFIKGEPQIGGSDNEHFFDPKGAAFDASGKLYVADCGNSRVQIYDSTGMWVAGIGAGQGTGDYELNCPAGVAVDNAGNIYIADGENHRIQIFDQSRTYLATLGETGVHGADNDHFNWPHDVDVDADGNIYVADLFNHRVQKFNTSREWVMTLGETGVCEYDAAHFCEPYGVAVDEGGSVYVVDKFGHRVRVFDSDGTFKASFGGMGIQHYQFRYPSGVDVDAEGNVYVADLYNHRVEKYSPGSLVFLPAVVSDFP